MFGGIASAEKLCNKSWEITLADKMGAVLGENGVSFRVWAPHADTVSVTGSFNDWQTTPMTAEDDGKWFVEIDKANVGDEYKFVIENGKQTLSRNDPYAREVTNSIGNSIVTDPNSFNWENDDFQMPPWNELVVYELHIGTFNRCDVDQAGKFIGIEKKLEYLQWLGVNAIEIMPVAEFAGDISWGYNPAHIFAVESAYGGPDALRRLVKAAHQYGIAVIIDVVYNHFGPSDLDLWRFDGWSENDKGGIYFYNDHRSATPWGDSRPDYGRGEVRQFIHDNAMMWLDEYRMDGLRYDMTLFIRSIDGSDENAIPEGWSLAQWINRDIHEKYPSKITIAEDLRSLDAITKPENWDGANFSTQWDESFVHPIREAISLSDDSHRDMNQVAAAISHRYNHDSFERVVYTESHDEVANGKKRVVSEIDEADPESWYARRRAALGAVMVFTSAGIPMIFQGQEFNRPEWFDDTNPIDWDEAGLQDQTMRLYHDLIRLRLNKDGNTAGLRGQDTDIFHIHDLDKVIAYRRASDDGEVVVVINLSHKNWEKYQIGFPTPGDWKVRFDSSSKFYAADGADHGIEQVSTNHAPHDWYTHSASFPLPAYSAKIFSMDA